MSTVNVALQATETTNRYKRPLLSSVVTLADVDDLAFQRVSLDRDEQKEITFSRLLICSVNIKILIQIEVGSTTIEQEFDSCMVLPFEGKVTFLNPSDNAIIIPAVVSYVAV